MDFKGKKIAVLGFGIEGESVVKFLLSQCSGISVFDISREELFDQATLSKLRKQGVIFQFGSYPDDFSDFNLVIRSPGVNSLSAIIKAVRKQKIPVTSLTKIFFNLCPCPIIGVTGTKGKGTTSALIYEMLKKQGLEAYLGGNIGNPALSLLDSLKSDSWVVLELSSFQLQDLDKSSPDGNALAGKPHIAVILMVTSEHLDYHRDIREYVDAKRNILRHQTSLDFAVINCDYPASNESDIHTQGQVYFVSREREVERGAFIRGGFVWLKTSEGEKKVVSIQDILLPGGHNLENVCAAVCAAYFAGVELPNISSVLKEFKGLEHRLELVRLVDGVRYYDDSFSTTPETAIAAIEAFDAPKILILGGSSKNSDFKELGCVIRDSDSIKAIIGIGEEWGRIYAEVKAQNSKVKTVEGCVNMGEIVRKAKETAEIGDVVLLSPACASFDMFKNYKDRGDQFKKEVNSLR